MAKQSIEEWVKNLPGRAVRVAVHVGEGKSPPLQGSILLADYIEEEATTADPTRIAGIIRARLDSGGWPDPNPTASVKAYAEGEKNPLDTWQHTDREASYTGGIRPGGELAVALKTIVDLANTLRAAHGDTMAAFVAERNYATDRAREAEEARSEIAELEAAATLLQGAVENHARSDELEVKLRGLETAEKTMDMLMVGKMHPEAMKKWAKANPTKAKALGAQLAADPELRALLLG